MTVKKIELCLCPDTVTGTLELAHLYGVDVSLCDVLATPLSVPRKPEGTTVIYLRPRPEGDYRKWLKKTLLKQFQER